MLTIKLVSLLLVLLVTILAGAYPFIKKMRSSHGHEFPVGEAFAAGVFLGAGLLHMLPDASLALAEQQYEYPLAFLLAGSTFLLLLLFEHIGLEVYQHQRDDSASFAILATVMLSIHSLLAGTALGLSQSWSVVIIILFAILAHKWAASFALAVQINKSHFNTNTGLILFAIFAAMVPLGVIGGNVLTTYLNDHVLLEPIFSALAAGTFLYLGTLHGLRRAVLVEKCCNLRHFSAVLVGFALMAVVAVWA